jgi:hypothetical protein
MNVRPAIAILPFAIACSCASFSNDLFLNRRVDAERKAEAVADQGAAAYEAELEGAGDYAKVPEIRRYFEVALSYDPANEKAAEYLDKIDDYSKSFVQRKLAVADRLLAKSPREEADDYAILSALQSARQVDSSNERVNKLLKEQGPTKDRLAASYLGRSLAAADRASPPKGQKGAPPPKAPSAAESEAAFAEAYVYAYKAVAIDPGNAKAAKAKSSALSELSKSFDARAAQVSGLISKSKFEEAKASLARLSAFDASVVGAFSPRCRELGYKLYLAWAKDLEGRKDLSGARDKADAALAQQRGDEALALRKRVVAALSSLEGEAAFDATLAEVDGLLAKGALAQAQRRLVALDRAAKDPARKSQVADRRAKLRAGLKPLYDKAVDAYRAESFKQAIESLKVVVAVDPDYEQASDYLEKAKQKQGLIDQFSK